MNHSNTSSKFIEVINDILHKTDKLLTKLITLDDLNEVCQATTNRQVNGRWLIKYD